MKEFLSEFWLWILVPFVLVVGGILVLYALAGGDTLSPFDYGFG